MTAPRGPLADAIHSALHDLFDDNDGLIDARDVHPEYLRGVLELSGNLLGLEPEERAGVLLTHRIYE